MTNNSQKPAAHRAPHKKNLLMSLTACFSCLPPLAKAAALAWLITGAGLHGLAQDRPALENDHYRIRLLRDGRFGLLDMRSGHEELWAPQFTVLYRGEDPGLGTVRVRQIAFVVPSWQKRHDDGRTSDLFRVADSLLFRGSRPVQAGRELAWSFPAGAGGTSLQAWLRLPEDSADPELRFTLKAGKPGWYSVGYTGAPEIAPEEVQAIWQPLVWQERRFPDSSYLSAEFMCSLPAALVNQGGSTIGVVADPSEIPFRFPQPANSRFGVALRNAGGRAQPMLFAPVLGQQASHLGAADTFSFRMRLVMQRRSIYETYRYIATRIMGFHDYRRNATCSLNETIEHMLRYAMDDDYSGWNRDLKAPDYATDVAGTVKAVSALHPLSIALITDDEQVYKRRALPMTEYLMSREKYLFSERPGSAHQSPSHYMRGPAAEVSELAALQLMYRGHSPVFGYYARQLYNKPRVLNLDMVSEGGSWQNALALYRMTGEQTYLDQARTKADAYIRQRIDTLQSDFSDVHIETGGQFWTDFAPKWIDLLELYETTREQKYLEAATRGAEEFVEYVWMTPAPPDTAVLINKGGLVGRYAYQNRLFPDPPPMKAPEQRVPAWRVAQTGLVSEASTTYVPNRAVFLAHHAAYLLRLSRYTGDPFFHAIARAAIVGRYANFPGYSIMGEYTTLYGRPDYPYHPLGEMTYNNIYYNHIWPQIALLMDYLITDAVIASEGRIAFPHRYAQGYAYLQSNVYGDRPGVFYGDRNVHLWMPAALLRSDNIQVNYVSGYGNGNLYVALVNQSAEAQNVRIQLNPDVVPVTEGQTYPVRLWKDREAMQRTLLKNGSLTVTMRPHGITAFAVEGLQVTPRYMRVQQARSAADSGHSHLQARTPLGQVTGMIIELTPALRNAYVWLDATEKELRSATIRYREGDTEKTLTDAQYPFEFSMPLSAETPGVEFSVAGVDTLGRPLHSGTLHLSR